MSIDLNTAGEQQTGTSLVIPPHSKVQVQLSIIYPEAGRAGASAPELTRAHSGLEYLATKLTVTRGSFAGKVMYQNFNLANAQTTGQQKAVDISIRSIRAMVEASRGIRPKDNSPTATQARKLQRWSELDGLTCFIVVDCEQSQPSHNGKVYINNRLYSVVTIDDPCYQQLTQQGEMISNEPVPEVQQTTAAAPAPRPSWVAQQPASAASAPTPAWGQAAPTQQPATPLQPAAPTPSWGATPPPPMAASANTDTVPF